jgi:hypothetical protein
MATNWTRGELWDKIVEQANNNPQYYEMLKQNPRGLMEKQLGTPIPASVNVKVLEESPDTYYIVLPYKAKEGAELSDSDLEKVAGGMLDGMVKGNASCTGGSGSLGTTIVDVQLG